MPFHWPALNNYGDPHVQLYLAPSVVRKLSIETLVAIGNYQQTVTYIYRLGIHLHDGIL